jgi:dTDP-4-dehydrorhamnose reductase
MKIALLGAQGQVGWEVAKLAKAQGLSVLAFDRTHFDVTDLAKTYQVLVAERPDIVINCTAYTAVDKAESEPELAFCVNRDAVAAMANACAALQIPLLHLSTDYVFNGKANRPYQEYDPTVPLGVYGLSKCEGEAQIRALHTQHIIVRTSWVFGAQGHNFVKTILRLAREREQLKIVADQMGCPTAAGDIAAMLLHIVQAVIKGNTSWGTYHFCSQPVVTWHAFATAIVECAHPMMSLRVNEIIPITTQDYPTPAQRPQYSVLDTDKIKQTFALQIPDWHIELRHIIEELAHATLPT